MPRLVRPASTLVACTLLLLGCGGASDVGEQATTAPVANAKALNHPFTESGGDIALRVRSGSEVRLSGKDSRGTVVPVLSFDWRANIRRTATRACAAEWTPTIRWPHPTCCCRIHRPVRCS